MDSLPQNDDLARRFERMQTLMDSLQRVAVAFSAGVDSTLVLKVALDRLGSDNVVAVTGRSASLAPAEFDDARALAESLGVEHVILDTDEFDNEAYLANPQNRCYFCKTTLYTHMDALMRERGLNAIVNGINADDYGDWRPGIQAAAEFEVRSPAAEAGLTKADIRALSQAHGLPTSDKPASPCLSSRVQYGERITPEKLHQIDQAERVIRQLGIRECRVRHHDRIARIEVPLADLPRVMAAREQVDARLRELGYTWVTIDLRGLRSGSLNDVVQLHVEKRSTT
jgi:uncharacterized protein